MGDLKSILLFLVVVLIALVAIFIGGDIFGDTIKSSNGDNFKFLGANDSGGLHSAFRAQNSYNNGKTNRINGNKKYKVRFSKHRNERYFDKQTGNTLYETKGKT